jgi:hypothetical protein
VVERVLSVSFLATAPPEEQRAIASEVRALLGSSEETNEKETIDLQYRTDVYVSRPRAALPGRP